MTILKTGVSPRSREGGPRSVSALLGPGSLLAAGHSDTHTCSRGAELTCKWYPQLTLYEKKTGKFHPPVGRTVVK